MKILKQIGALILAAIVSAVILYGACFTPSFIELRWFVLLLPALLFLVLLRTPHFKTLRLSLLVGLMLPILMFLETRFPVMTPSFAEKIGGQWPHNYGELRYQWRHRAYWLLDFWLFQRKFESDAWKQAPVNSAWPVHLHMTDDLIQNSSLHGLNQDQVHTILGLPGKQLGPPPPVCNPDESSESTLDSYPLVWVNNFEYRLNIEYSNGIFLCAYRHLRIVF